MQEDRPSAVYLFLFLSPQAHLGERLKEACDGHPYMLWTSRKDHREHGHCGSGESMWIFSVGYDHMVLLRAWASDEELQWHSQKCEQVVGDGGGEPVLLD